MVLDKTKLTKNLANDQILVPYLDKVFDTWDGPFKFEYVDKEHDDAWHPSGDCLPKASELYYKATHEAGPSKIGGGLRKAFVVGHFWHQLLQDVILNDLEFCEAEAIERVGEYGWNYKYCECTCNNVGGHSENCEAWRALGYYPYSWVRGSGDIAPLEAPNGWSGLVDIKTMNGADYKKAASSGLLPERFEAKYVAQINIYMKLFDMDQAMILGVNKDAPHGFTEFNFVRDDQLIDAIVQKWKFVSECLEAQHQPTEEEDQRYELPLK